MEDGLLALLADWEVTAVKRMMPGEDDVDSVFLKERKEVLLAEPPELSACSDHRHVQPEDFPEGFALSEVFLKPFELFLSAYSSCASAVAVQRDEVSVGVVEAVVALAKVEQYGEERTSIVIAEGGEERGFTKVAPVGVEEARFPFSPRCAAVCDVAHM